MDISEYTGLFHDGAILDIRSKDNGIEFFMHSAEVDAEDLQDKIPLSKEDTISGKLHVEEILSIELDKHPFSGLLEKKSSYGSIYDLEITEKSVSLLVEWVHFSCKNDFIDMSSIRITAKKIYWENIPDLIDQFP